MGKLSRRQYEEVQCDYFQLNSNGEDDGMTWEIDWDNMVCVDEYGDDGDIPTAKVHSVIFI